MPTTPDPFSDAAAAALLDDALESWEHDAEKPGAVIGAYRLVEKIGEGGFGIVWRAEQTEPVRREVALKLLKRGMDSRQILARFSQERRMLAAMEHPSIATMLDAGVSPDGRPFFVMEMLRGLSITAYCEQHALPLREKIALLRDVCGAVQHAHQKGVIHRDLKPSNVLVVQVDGQALPKIIDFGIAKAVGTTAVAAMTLATQAHFVLGTPQYMSPEQIADGSNVDTRTDIYALGALLYELLAGVPPFDPQTAKVKGPQELHRLIREQPPQRPSTAYTTQHLTRPALEPTAPQEGPRVLDATPLPADLDWITLRALEKEPDRRYQSATEFAADLQRFLNHEPVLAHPPSATYVASRWIRRHRVIFAAACLSLMAVVDGAGVALWQASVARAAQRRAEAESHRSRETAEFVTSMLMEVAEEVHKGRNPEALRLALISSQKRIAAMSQDADLQIALITQVADLFKDMSDWRLATAALRQRAEMIAACHGPDSAEARAAAFTHLHMVIDQGDRIKGVQGLTELRGRIEQHEGHGSAPWFEAQRLLVRAWTKLRDGRAAVAVAAATAAEARQQKLPEPLMHEVLMQHADALMAARKFDAALAVVAECRSLDTAGLHQEGLEQKEVQILAARGDHAAAADRQQKVVERLRGVPGFNVQRLLFHLGWLAELEVAAHRHEAATAHVNEALALARKISSTLPADGDSAHTLREDMVKLLEIRIASCRQLKKHAEALALAQEALDIARQSGNQTLLSRSLSALAEAYESAGSLDDAWRVHAQIYELHAAHNASYKNRLDNLRDMSRLRLRQDRPKDALKHAQDAWHQALAQPSSHAEPDYLAYMAAPALKAWKALHAAAPDAPPPPELEAWQEAMRNEHAPRP